MPTYQYETIPPKGGSPRRFEIRQTFDDPALTIDPLTGDPVRRVISGGIGILTRDASGPGAVAQEGETGPACGPESCTCGRFD